MRIQDYAIALMAVLGVAAGCTAADDGDFARQATSTGLLEVELGNYAAMNAEAPEVKRFGRLMVDDHSRANQELEQLAREEGIRLQSSMTPEHREEATRLMSLHGAEFDAAYAKAMVEGHEKAVESFGAQASQNRSDIDRWAANKLPALREHLALARALEEDRSAEVSLNH